MNPEPLKDPATAGFGHRFVLIKDDADPAGQYTQLLAAISPFQAGLVVGRNIERQVAVLINREKPNADVQISQNVLGQGKTSNTDVYSANSMRGWTLLRQQERPSKTKTRCFLILVHPQIDKLKELMQNISKFSNFLPTKTASEGWLTSLYVDYDQHLEWNIPTEFDPFNL